MAAVATLGRRGRVGFAYDRGFRWFAVAPALALLLLISLFPVAYNIVISLKGITLADADGGFVGLANFVRLGSDARFWDAILRTAAMMVVLVAAQVVLGVALAVFFTGEIAGKRWFVALLVLPAMISPIVAGETWRLLLDASYGPIDQILGWISGHSVGILWVVDENYVFLAIAIVEIWEHTPFVFLLTFAALEAMDRTALEAAAIDGASGWTAFWRIVLPAIWPVLAMVILIRALDLMRLFEVVWVLTRGGPGTMTETASIYIYRLGFQDFDTSYTAAATLVLVAVLGVTLALALRRIEVIR